MSRPYTSIGSDAVVDWGGHPHPRLYGTFPRVLGRFVRELGAFSLPEAVAKMTARAASVVGMGGRVGRIAAGLPADLVLFDPETVTDRATYESPLEAPLGIAGVWVAGRRVVADGKLLPDAVAPAGDPSPGAGLS
jgi:N-acyl-D-aspartate/D-glutamate deacylase